MEAGDPTTMQSMMSCDDFLTESFEFARDLGPRVAAFDKLSTGHAKGRPSLWILQQGDDGVGELARIIGDHDVLPRYEREALSTHAR